jgi:ubiquinone biosynthesis protein
VTTQDDKTKPAVWRLSRTLTQRASVLREELVPLLRRCRTIAGVSTHRSALACWYTATRRLGFKDDMQDRSIPRQVRLALEELGPTFVKLGQVLSARSDISSPELQHELSKLRDHAPSITRAQLEAELGQSLGSWPSSPFATFEMAPTACGSIAQVHRATLQDGSEVAVKLRRPGVRTEIDADLSVLRKMVQLAAALSSWVRAYDPVSILDEFAELLRKETDFLLEAENLQVVRAMFASSNDVTIPRVVADLSGESVLVMDWVKGVPLSDHEGLEAAGVDKGKLARAILQAYGVMIFEADRFHADPHPGNLIAVHGERLALVDFGEVGTVDPAERAALWQMIAALLGRDTDALAEAMRSVCRPTRDYDDAAFAGQLQSLVDDVTDTKQQDLRLGEVLLRLLHVLRTFGMVLPSDMAVLIKTAVECEDTAMELDPSTSLLEMVGQLGVSPPPYATEAP